MFIAIALPAIFAVKSFYKIRRNTVITCLFVLCFALILLDCRTAWISIALIAVIYGNKRYGLLNKFGTLNNVYKAIIALSVIALITFAGIWLYQHKKSSANGRLLIWKISAQMVAQKSITGVGYGLFEREYNLFQANYFNHHQENILEKANAGFVHMAYNEFMQNTVEGGVIGLALLCAIFYYLLKPISFKDEDKEEEAYRAAYWGIWVFILMSLINFTIQAIPVMCVLLIYGAMLAGSPYQRPLFVIHANHQHKTSRLKYIGAFILLVGIWLTYSVSQIIRASYINKQVASQVDAVQMLEPLNSELADYESYWTNYGNVLMKQGAFEQALLKYHHSKLFTSDPEIYFRSGICYERLGNADSAVSSYQQSAALDPNKMKPRFALMRMYLKMTDTVSAVRMASEIISMPVKVATEQADRYQQRARQLLNKTEILNKSENLNQLPNQNSLN